MIKLLKFYILLGCTALCLSGCGKENVVSEEEKAPVQEVEVNEPVEEEILEAEKKYHPIKKGAIDYLSVKGIELEPGTEIAMVATNSENKFLAQKTSERKTK